MRVLVRPAYDYFLGNKLFTKKEGHDAHWLKPYVQLHQAGREQQIEFATWDMYPLETADVVMFQDLPARRDDVLRVRSEAPQAKLVLQLLESPVGRPHWFVKENHDLFDAVLTYNYHLCDDRRYFHYDLPIGDPQPVTHELSFAERKTLVMLNSNLSVGFLGAYKPDLSAIPFFRLTRCGWRVPRSAMLNSTKGELYSRRRHLARTADAEFPGMLDVFGPGWSGDAWAWSQRYFGNKPYQSARGSHDGRNKIEVLSQYKFSVAFENVQADVGYISEKMLDPFFAGVVPIYLGDVRVAERIPPESFIDARQFRNDRELLRFVQGCSETEWRSLREKGQEFLRSPAMDSFRPEAFASKVISVMLGLSGRH